MDISSVSSFWERTWPQVEHYSLNYVLTWAMAVQLAVGGLAFLLAYKAMGAILSWFERRMPLSVLDEGPSDLRKIRTFLKLARPILSVVCLGIAFRMARHFNLPAEGLEALLNLAFAVFFVRLLATPIKNRYWAKILTVAIILWAIFRVFHSEHLWTNLFSNIYVEISSVRISLLTSGRAFVLLLILYWLSKNLLLILDLWLQTVSSLPVATRTLLHKLCTLLLLSTSVVIVLHYLGIDLTVFALFSGALGLGIGFGMQKIVANLISGYMILADKSIKPGDVIQLGKTYGSINFLGSRYVSVVTRNAIEHLIPNESLITGEVINWSYSNNLLRLQVPVGISYDADLEKATKLILEAAADTRRILQEPKAACLVTGFGDNGLNLELRVWINDPQNGLGSIKDELLRGVLRRFMQEGIKLPYSQMVLHHESKPRSVAGPNPPAQENDE